MFVSIEVFVEDDIDYSEAIHQLFDWAVKEGALDVLEDGLCLIEDVIDLREGFLELMSGMFFLYVVKWAFDIHDLELYHVYYLLELVIQPYFFLIVLFEKH